MESTIKSTPDTKNLVLTVLIIVGLVLTFVGMFGSFLKLETTALGLTVVTYPTLADIDHAIKTLNEINVSYEGFDVTYKDLGVTYEGFAVTNFFAWATFVLAIVLTVLFIVAKVRGIKELNKIVAFIGYLTVVAAILVFIFAIGMARKNSVGVTNVSVKYTISAGPILMLIGGILVGGSAIRLGMTHRKPLLAAPTCIDQTDKTLQKMKDLVDAGVLSEKQYEEKKQEIAKQKERPQSDNDIDANIKKLKDLVDAGFLSEEDYEKKRNELEDQKRKNRASVIRDENIVKLKELCEAGILSTEDYEKKKKEVEEKYRQQDIEYMTLDEMIDYLKEQKSLVDNGSLSKDVFEKMRTDLKPLKKLRGMVDSGIITQEEYEAKKKEITEIYEE